MNKIIVLSLIILSSLTLPILITTPTLAQTPCLAQATNPRAGGLISSAGTVTKFGNYINSSAICVKESDQAAFVSYKLPTYADLKSIYYTQAKSSISINKESPFSDNPNYGQFNSAITISGKDTLFLVQGNLIVSNSDFPSSPSDRIAVVLVDGNLDITDNITSGTETTGLVFIVGGNVNIAPSVIQINAVIVSSGTIFTAGASCSNPTAASQLIIDGSLVSLDSGKPIKFCRDLGATNSTQPAEKIIHQPKYTVILKEIFSSNLNKWTEIAGVPYIPPTPGPTSPPTPTPTPTTPPPPPLAMVSPPTQSAGLSPRTWSQNCGSSTYRMLIVIAADWRGNSTSPITSITYPKLGNPVPLTRLTPPAYIGNFISPDPGGAFAEMFYMIDPDPGPNNITANFSGSLSFGSSCWQGVSQVAPADYRFLAGNSTTPSITVPSSSSDIIIDGVSVLWSQTIEAGSGQTQLANISAGNSQVGHSSKPPTFISTTMSWNNTTVSGLDGRWAMVGAALKPAP